MQRAVAAVAVRHTRSDGRAGGRTKGSRARRRRSRSKRRKTSYLTTAASAECHCLLSLSLLLFSACVFFSFYLFDAFIILLDVLGSRIIAVHKRCPIMTEHSQKFTTTVPTYIYDIIYCTRLCGLLISIFTEKNHPFSKTVVRLRISFFFLSILSFHLSDSDVLRAYYT